MVLLSATNIFSLLIGIYLGDAIIDAALFMNQELTVKLVFFMPFIYFSNYGQGY